MSNQKGKCGKTTVTTNLGVVYSKLGYKVLCVDGDKRVDMTRGLIKGLFCLSIYAVNHTLPYHTGTKCYHSIKYTNKF